MDSKESMRIRGLAASYAKHFLTQKYKQEYDELYNAYLKNRGITTRRFRKPLIDERITSE
jgi:hypothetical protein